MKRLAILAIATAAVVLPPAVAHADTGTARYATLKSCPKEDYRVPCGSWTLTLRGGKQVALTDALIFPAGANGKVVEDMALPVRVSADGRRVAYFRKADRRLVVRDVVAKKVITLPAEAARVPKGLHIIDVGTFLSKDGTVLVVDYLDDTVQRPSLIVEVDTGEVHTIKGTATVETVSPGGDYVLTTRYTDENTFEYTSYDKEGNEVNSQIVPQVVTNNGPVALADDGSTVAVVVSSNAGAKSLRTYDLASDTVGPKVTIAIPKQEGAQRLLWDTSDQIVLWSYRDADNYAAIWTTSWQVNAGTGAATKTDTFKIKSKIWDYRVPGG
ncbi:hypothetical protein Acor_76590 [Acrocarpospora corrugata]|uniref:Lipoprotein n=1 Tax=Acrocarpospora corrugata TaxID=35763 RepID=A0A5M3WET9_9ACTN|nr:hypothetical protein [Acrocarpospora corrugata]GES05591.1 hypothetical protein Acor_76590 [Acrocarpospora corrugata]